MNNHAIIRTVISALISVAMVPLAAHAAPRPDLYEVVKDPDKVAKLAKAIENAIEVDPAAWLHSLEQTTLYLELTKKEEPDFQPQAAMPVTPEALAAARRVFAEALEGERSGKGSAEKALAAAVRDGRLQVVRIIPGTSDGRLRATQYYAARVPARREKGDGFVRPLHRLPPDSMRDAKGRLPTKQEVHSGVLVDKVPIIAWLTPSDEAAVQMQGSGLLEFPGGEVLSINYEGNNGYKWTEELDDVRESLKKEHGKGFSQHWPKFKKRHTFHRPLVLEDFRHLKLKPGQFLGFDRPFERKMPITERISTAMDPAMVPSGVLGVLTTSEGPSRLIKVDDQGAAFIDRPDKIDLFWGSYTPDQLAAGKGADGKPIGTFPDWGQLYFLIGSPR